MEDKARNVLLVSDPQNGFRNEHSERAFPVIAKIMPLFDIVLITTFFNPDGSLHKENMGWHKFDANSPEDRALAIAIPEGVAPVIIETSSENKMANDRVRSTIDAFKLKKIFLCGFSTDCSILNTAVGSWDSQIVPIVIKDACASNKSEEQHEKAISLITRSIGKKNVIQSSELGQYLI